MGVKLGPLHRVRVFENSMLKNNFSLGGSTKMP